MFQPPTSESAQKSPASRTVQTPKPVRELHPATPAWGGSLAGQVRGGHQRSTGFRSTVGNQAVLRMMSGPRQVMQTKLTVNEPGDRYEQEADRVADHVMRMPEPTASRGTGTVTAGQAGVQRKCSCGGTCSECKDKHEEEHGTLQRKPASAQIPGAASPQATAEAPPSVHEVLRSPGRSLDRDTRAFFEPRFGQDFSAVRIHTDARAAESARAIHARAYTVGSDIVFASGEYSPTSNAGMRLLGHELTHTLQQGGFVRRQPSPEFQVLSPSNFDTHSQFPLTLPDSQSQQLQGLFYYTEPEKGCTGCHPTVQRPTAGPPPVRYEQVTENNLIEWLNKRVWKQLGRDLGRKAIFSGLQRKTKELDTQVKNDVSDAIAIVSSSLADGHDRQPTFIGAQWARDYFAKYLKAYKDELVSGIEDRAQEWLDIETVNALQSKLVPEGASLVIDDPKRVDQIENHAELGETFLDIIWNGQSTAKVGFKWNRKTIKSIHQIGEKTPINNTNTEIYFELDAYPGIYFEMSGGSFANKGNFGASVFQQVYDSTKIWMIIGDCLGKFAKGIVEAVAGIGLVIIDAGAKLVDMISLYNAVQYKALYGIDVPYTCLSSTCRQYEKCTENPKEHSCQTNLLTESLKQAAELVLPVIPLGESAVECVTGSCEACGEVAAMFLPTHEAITSIHEALRGKAGERGVKGGTKAPEPPEPKVEVNKRREPPTKSRAVEKITDPATKKAVDVSARRQLHIDPATAEAEVVELTEAAKDPANVGEPSDPQFDAEIKVSDGKITYKRERNTTIWDRCWNPCERGGSVGPKVEAETDAALRSKKKGAKTSDKGKETSPKGKGADAGKPGPGDLNVEITQKQAKRLEKVAEAARAEAMGDDSKWGKVSPYDRFRLGRVYDSVLEQLISAAMKGVQTTLHYVELTPKLIRELRAKGERVLLTEVRLPRIGRRYDFLEIDFRKGKGDAAELIDLAATEDPRHTEKTREGKREVRKLLGGDVTAKELLYTGPNGELLEPLVELEVK